MKSMYDLARDIKEAAEACERAKKDMPRRLGKKAVDVTKENFVNQGFEGQRWKERAESTDKQYDRRGSYKGSVYSSKSPILRQTNNLFNSIQFRVRGKMIEIGIFEDRIIKYAQRHNEGIGNSPKRQFIGYTLKMDIILRSRIEDSYKRIFKKFSK